jgi:nucleotide-binding universal stress UspA family protein
MNMKTMTARQKRITELNRVKQAAIGNRRGARTECGARASRSKARANGHRGKVLVGVKSILVPTDFSERSLDALAYAENIAELTGAKLTLISVFQPVMLPVPLTTLALENDQALAATKTKLRELAAAHGIEPEMLERTVVSQGAAWDEIVRAARNLKSDLIVIATHGHTGVTHAILGSTAERVIRHAHCPVLVVR